MKVYSCSRYNVNLIGEFDISPGASLRGADLSGANLSFANLSFANLSFANLSGANLRGVNLDEANLEDAKLPKFQIPQDEELIVFKKLRDDKIAKLRIPARAKRTASLRGNKCRAERAIVVDIYDLFNSKIKYQTGRSLHDQNFIYEVGKEVEPTEEYDGDIRAECLPGIHFFMTEEEAKKYDFR